VETGVVNKIKERFGKMTITRGKQHVFLGMNITYLDNGTAEISMPDYEESITELGENVNKTAASALKRDLCENCEKSKMLEKIEGETFHSIVAKLLHVSHRGTSGHSAVDRFPLHQGIMQYQTRLDEVEASWEYLNGTLKDVRIIGADDLVNMKTWVDASYAVHMDTKSHMGGVVYKQEQLADHRAHLSRLDKVPAEIALEEFRRVSGHVGSYFFMKEEKRERKGRKG
jgi:hypothetical protein